MDFMYLLNEVNARLEIEAKVNEFPFNALLLVLLLLKDKHVVIEELLKLLIREINAQLLKWIDLTTKINKLIKMTHWMNEQMLLQF